MIGSSLFRVIAVTLYFVEMSWQQYIRGKRSRRQEVLLTLSFSIFLSHVKFQLNAFCNVFYGIDLSREISGKFFIGSMIVWLLDFMQIEAELARLRLVRQKQAMKVAAALAADNHEISPEERRRQEIAQEMEVGCLTWLCFL